MSYVPEYINRQLNILHNGLKPKEVKDDALFRLASHLDIDLNPNSYTESEKKLVLAKAKKIIISQIKK